MWIYYKILFPILSRNLSVRIVNRRYLVELPIKLCSSFFLFAEQPWIIKNIRWQKAETKAVINFIRIRRNVFIFKQNVCNRFTHVIINYRYLKTNPMLLRSRVKWHHELKTVYLFLLSYRALPSLPVFFQTWIELHQRLKQPLPFFEKRFGLYRCRSILFFDSECRESVFWRPFKCEQASAPNWVIGLAASFVVFAV